MLGFLDRLLESIGLTTGHDPLKAQSSVAFTVAIVALAAKLSKADGVSSQVEADTFFKLYDVPAGEIANVRRLYDLAKQDASGFEHYADRIGRLFRGAPQLRIDVLEALFHIAAADGVLHRAEEAFLQAVASRLEISAGQYAATRSHFVADADDPYVVLGLSRHATNDEIKARWRKLAKETHPDTMIARGVPETLTAHATRKLQTINAAYERIARERGL